MASVVASVRKDRVRSQVGERIFWVLYFTAPLIAWWVVMDNLWSIGSCAALINHAAGTYYNREMYHRRIKPDGVAWAILAFAGVLFTGSHFFLRGDGSGAMFFMSTFDMIVTAGIAIWRHHEPIVRDALDQILFVISLCSGVLCISMFWAGSNPTTFLVVLVINCCVDFIGMRLVIKNAFVHGRENWRPWALTATACAINLFAVDHWISTEMILPAYFFAVNIAMFLVVSIVALSHKARHCCVLPD